MPSPKEGNKEKPQRHKKETLKEKIAMAIVRMVFFHILGRMGELVHVASEGLSIDFRVLDYYSKNYLFQNFEGLMMTVQLVLQVFTLTTNFEKYER